MLLGVGINLRSLSSLRGVGGSGLSCEIVRLSFDCLRLEFLDVLIWSTVAWYGVLGVFVSDRVLFCDD